ncbi:MAG TPA: ABC transporter substrate-binding protein [Natronosporangium sp.]
MTPTLWRLVAGGAGVALAVALTGCNDPGVRDASSGEDGTLRISAGIASVSSLNSINAQLLWADPSLAEAHNLEIDWMDFGGSSPNCWTAVIAGEVDLCVASPAGATAAIAEGQELVFVTSLTDVMSELVVSPELAAAAGGPDAPVEERLAALAGATIATSNLGTSHAAYLDLMLDRVGLRFGEEVNALTLTDPVAMIEGIKNGQFDGAIWTVGSFETGIAAGDVVRLISTPAGDEPRLQGVPFVIAAGNKAWVDANTDAVDAFRAALNDAAAAIVENPDDAATKLKAEFFPDMEESLFRSGFEQVVPLINMDGKVTEEAWQLNLDILQQSNENSLEGSGFDTESIYPAMRG